MEGEAMNPLRSGLNFFSQFCLGFGFFCVHLFRALSGTAFVSVLLSFAVVPLWAENVVYNGDPAMLQSIPDPYNPGFFLDKSVAPGGSTSGKSNSVSGNKVTVNVGVTDPDYVFGAVNFKNDGKAVTDNKVTINNGVTVQDSTYGGAAVSSGGVAATATGNSVTMTGVQGGKIVGGGADVGWDDDGAGNYTGGKATASGNNVTLTDSSGWLVIGGGTDGASDTHMAEASNNTVNISGTGIGSSGASWMMIIGGGVTNHGKGGGAATGNTVTIGGDTMVHEVVGGMRWRTSRSSTFSFPRRRPVRC